ncbi:MAG: hypothetical protein FJ100_12255 [Deltaproteobacteria bacterium]|nr:hypothetical protein [Deltaproteobacteria bacterium]
MRLRSFTLMLVLSASPALAQESLPVATPPPGDVTPVAAPVAPAVVAPVAMAPEPAPVVPPVPTPPLLTLRVGVLAAGQRTSSFAADRFGAMTSDAPEMLGRARTELGFDTGKRLGQFAAMAALSGEWVRTYARRPVAWTGDRLPDAPVDAYVPTEAWAGWRLGDVAQVRAGWMTSHWGMGLLANDGSQAQATDNWFTLPKVGDRVLRGALVLTPWRGTDSPLAGLVVSAAVDHVQADDIQVGDDAAEQVVAAVKFYTAPERWLGAYYVARRQTATSGRGLEIHAVDLAGDYARAMGDVKVRLQGELAVIAGSTTLAPTPDHPTHDVMQFGAVGRATVQFAAAMQAQLDALYLSGDASLDDGKIGNFRADPNLQFGLVLFQRLLAAQSGRARVSASDPDLVGVPNVDLDRIATGGAATSTVAVFPKFGWKAADGLSIYGGALLAWSPLPLADPRASKTQGGGHARNFLGNAADGSYLGTELDLGVRYRAEPRAMDYAVAIGVEAAALMPGGVLAGLDQPVTAARLVLTLLPKSTTSF